MGGVCLRTWPPSLFFFFSFCCNYYAHCKNKLVWTGTMTEKLWMFFEPSHARTEMDAMANAFLTVCRWKWTHHLRGRDGRKWKAEESFIVTPRRTRRTRYLFNSGKHGGGYRLWRCSDCIEFLFRASNQRGIRPTSFSQVDSENRQDEITICYLPAASCKKLWISSRHRKSDKRCYS